jgi:hypothetical protein
MQLHIDAAVAIAILKDRKFSGEITLQSKCICLAALKCKLFYVTL